MTRIVVLGGGFAGVAVAHRLERRLRPDEAEIAIVSRDNFTLFTPMLPEVSSGGIELRHVVTPVRSQVKRTTFVLGEIARIDLDARLVEATHPITGATTRLEYDQLVLALGSVDLDLRHPRGRGAHAAAQDAGGRRGLAQPRDRLARAGRRHAARAASASGC